MDGSVHSLLVLSRLNNMLKTHLLDKISNMGSYLKYCLHVANEHITLLTEKRCQDRFTVQTTTASIQTN